MTEDVLTGAIEGAKAALDTDERLWIVGVAHLVDVPEVREFTADEVNSVIDLAMKHTQFPNGPVGSLVDGFTQTSNPDYRLITLRSDAAPHLEMQLGLGISGYVAVGLTCSGNVGDGVVHPAGVFLSDFESVLADTYSLAVAAAVQLRYLGPIEMVFDLAYDAPQQPFAFYALDEDTGRTICVRDGVSEFSELRHRLLLSASSTPYSLHQDLNALGQRFVDQVGWDGPQLVTLMREDSEAYRDVPLPNLSP